MKNTALVLFLALSAICAKAQVFVKATSIDQIVNNTECIFVSENYVAAEIISARFLNREEVEIQEDGSIQSVSDACIYKIKKSSGKCGLQNKDGKYIDVNHRDLSYSNKGTYIWNLEEKNGGITLYTSNNYYLVCSFYGNDDHKFQANLKVESNDYAYIYIKSDDAPPPTPTNPSISIGDGKDDNSTVIKAYSNKQVDVEIVRTFQNDNGWYTLCLPFDLTTEDLHETLKAKEVLTFCSASSDEHGGVELYFLPVNDTKAGEPCLIKVAEEVCNPVFKEKTITANEPKVVMAHDQKQQLYQMKGIYDPKSFADAEEIDQVRFVSGSDGTTLRKPSVEGQLKGLRAYFILPKGIANAYIKNTTDGTRPTVNPSSSSNCLKYDLTGRETTNAAQDIIIINGKKYLSISSTNR